MDGAADLTITIPEELARRIVSASEAYNLPPAECALVILDNALDGGDNPLAGQMDDGREKLIDFIRRLPTALLLCASDANQPLWWVRFLIDFDLPAGWHVVQNLGFVLNVLLEPRSADQPFPVVFRPVSSDTRLYGGTHRLQWEIAAQIPFLAPGMVATLLEARLPQPVEDETLWLRQGEHDEDEA